MQTAEGVEVPRPLTRREEAVLVAMIKNANPWDDDVPVTDADRSRWLAQVSGTRAGRPCGCGTCPSIGLTNADGLTPDFSESRVVLQASATGALLGLLHE